MSPSLSLAEAELDTSSTLGEPGVGKVMVLMRGLPSCGKTHTSKKLAERSGVVFEFDEFFYTQVGDAASRFDWSDDLLPQARRWNMERIKRAIDEGISPVIVDSDNSIDRYTRGYVSYAIECGYDVQLKEPESPWWRQIRGLLQDKESNQEALAAWARKLVAVSQGTHRVPLSMFIYRIDGWKSNVTIEDILQVN